MSHFIIRGGKAIGGLYRPAGNKNAAMPMLAACLLTDEEVRLGNVPMIRDVENVLALLADLGVEVEREGHEVRLCAAGVRKTELDAGLCAKVRGSVLLAGPLAARHGKALLPPPGGDVIGRRRLDTHFEGLGRLGIGVDVAAGGEGFVLRRGAEFRGAEMLLDEASVTATENVLMAAALAPGKTMMLNAACEPHVQNLARMLNGMGARIRGAGSNRLEIEGVERLHGVAERVDADYVEMGSFFAAAAATGGRLVVEEAPDGVTLRVMERLFGRLGVAWREEGGRLTLESGQALEVRPDWGGGIPKIEDGIWPATPSDLMSVALVLATRAKGTVLFFEKLFESRMYFVDRLLDMGARVVACDPHRVLVSGPSALRGKHLTSPDIRAGMALMIAALCAEGRSVIDNADMVDRGYERIDERLRELGAEIEREE